jgi:ABC-type bacteriocin/lantibiotic exporter with double-glycine peptidase domain
MFGSFSWENALTGGIITCITALVLALLTATTGGGFTFVVVCIFLFGSVLFCIDWGWVKAWVQLQFQGD